METYHRSWYAVGPIVSTIIILLSAIYSSTSTREPAVDLSSKEISAEEYLALADIPREFRGIDIPKVFTHYDLNRDRKISLIELAEVTSTEEENARRPFEDADADGDEYLTVGEFSEAPWLFEANDVVLDA